MSEMKVLTADQQPETGAALKRALEMTAADVVFEVRESGMRGRGGAGFPVGIKWNLAGAASGTDKMVICNADEGEPGTFKDRLLIEKYAKQLLEGMTIAGYAIGSSRGIIYLRAEYTYLIPAITEARRELIDRKLMGSYILGGSFNFDVEVRPGAGAYVCGEETSLIESLEGKRGEPRNKPPFPVNSGYLCRPTIVNNVETFVNVPHIILNGSDWYRELGIGDTTGTKLFSVSGDVERSGVYEMQMGSTIGELLELAGAKDVQAVQVGGASGATIAADELDRRLSFEDLPPGGSVIVFNRSRNMMNVLENFLEFFVHESCGQCTPCREGNVRLLDTARAIRDGRITSREELKDFFMLAEIMKLGSKCGLGQTSPNCFVDIVTKFVELPGGKGGM
ncbi:MAG: SLBB domain-containing protein [Candidatus Fermentibacteraceae bacterium]|nr:SLBB domain-containing protein [Candidatus Fermentibacteraceae bacterium]MBN2608934.1 SLBB domain-containing protein [Candidatus Fermentibacteraceae bacterium]